MKSPSASEVATLHRNADRDGSRDAMHHSLGLGENQASPGVHIHDGRESKLLGGYVTKSNPAPTVTGSRGGNAALASLLTALASQGIITDNTAV